MYLLYSTTWRCLQHLIKQNCFLKTFLLALILITWVFFLLFFPSRTNLKLHNVSITPKMVKKVIMNPDSSKVSDPNCIPVVVLKICDLPELSYILAGFFNMCLKDSYFPDFERSHRWSLFSRMLGKGLLLKIAALLVFFLWLVKSLKNL